MLLKLKDGGIEKIDTHEMSYPGCPTCDYGSQYINEFDITLTQFKVHAEVSQMYAYRVSSGDLMNLILPNIDKISQMTEREFIDFVSDWLNKRDDFDSYRNVEVTVDVQRRYNDGKDV